jgi:hypothetical protein
MLGSDYSLKSAIGLANSTAMAKAYAIILDNPQLASWTSAIQAILRTYATTVDLSCRLSRRTMIPGCSCGGYAWKLCKVQIQGDQNPAFASNSVCERLVIRSREIFVPNSLCIETRLAQRFSRLGRKILVRFELHTLSSTGRSIVPSRANSAA